MTATQATQATYSDGRRRLFDSPYDPAIRDEMLVIGDALEAEGDPLGRRVALSESLFLEADRKRRAALRTELESFAETEARALLGAWAPYRTYRGALTIEWRAGVAIAANIDARYLTKLSDITPAELVKIVIDAPILGTVRRLGIRTRGRETDLSILDTLAEHGALTELEELLVGPNPRPRKIHPIEAFTWPLSIRPAVQRVAAALPRLRLCALGILSISLPPRVESAEWPIEARAAELLEIKSPVADVDRLHIGRALWSSEPALRRAATQAIAAHRLLGGFASSLALLLRPGVCPQQDEIARAIGESRERCPPLDAQLLRVAGDSRYDQPTRSAAGRAASRRSRADAS